MQKVIVKIPKEKTCDIACISISYAKIPYTFSSLVVILAYLASENYQLLIPSTYESLKEKGQSGDYYMNVFSLPVMFCAFYSILYPFMKQRDVQKGKVPVVPGTCCPAVRLSCMRLLYMLAGGVIAFFKNTWLLTDDLIEVPDEGQAVTKAVIGVVQLLSIVWLANQLAVIYASFAAIVYYKPLVAEPLLLDGEEKQVQRSTSAKQQQSACFNATKHCFNITGAWASRHLNTLTGVVLVTGFVLATYNHLFSGHYDSNHPDFDWVKGVHIVASVIASVGMIMPFALALDTRKNTTKDYSSQSNSCCAWFCNTANISLTVKMILAATMVIFNSYFIADGATSDTDKGLVITATALWMLWSVNRLAVISNKLTEQILSERVKAVLPDFDTESRIVVEGEPSDSVYDLM